MLDTCAGWILVHCWAFSKRLMVCSGDAAAMYSVRLLSGHPEQINHLAWDAPAATLGDSRTGSIHVGRIDATVAVSTTPRYPAAIPVLPSSLVAYTTYREFESSRAMDTECRVTCSWIETASCVMTTIA